MNESQRHTLQRVSGVLRRWEYGLDADLGQDMRELLATVDGALERDAVTGTEYQLVLQRIEQFLAALSGRSGQRAS